MTTACLSAAQAGYARTASTPQLPADLDGGQAKVLVGVDGRLAGVALIGDRLRADAVDLVPRLREVGVRHVALVTGDKGSVAETVGRHPRRRPRLRRPDARGKARGRPSAPASGPSCEPSSWSATASTTLRRSRSPTSASPWARPAPPSPSETADAVILVDRVDRVADAIRIGRRSLHIARQSVLVGIALSLVAMGFAAAGYLPPVQGALLQEGIDVAVILNALRALTD